METAHGIRYRPEIDGLRAVAVLPVVFYHAGLGFPGGFTGVDVFFVISGYLITSIIVKDLRAGNFSMVAFWERRARRILPAGVVLVAATLLVGSLVLPAEDAKGLGSTAIAQALFASNLYFERKISYFSGEADEMPLLHTWSLAVEEQFYLFVPMALWALFRWKKMREPRLLLSVTVAALFVSLIYSAFQVRLNQQAAFYLLPSRAWELLVGSTVALLPVAALLRSQPLRNFGAALGLAVLALSYWLYDTSTLFPGESAVLPCVGAAVFIWASQNPEGGKSDTLVAQLLTSRPAVFVGKISYSLYLWHWPLIAFANYWSLPERGIFVRLAIVVLSFALAIASYWFVETPFRERRIASTRPAILTFAALAVVAVCAGGATLRLTDGLAFRYAGSNLAPLTAEIEDREQRNRTTSELSVDDALSRRFLHYEFDRGARTRLFVWGDSHARAALPGILDVARKQNCNVEAAWHGATPPAIRFSSSSSWSFGKDAPKYNLAVLDYVREQRPPHVLLAAFWELYFPEGSPGKLGAELVTLTRELTENGSRVWVLLDWPAHKMKVPRLLFGEERFGLSVDDFSASRAMHHEARAAMQRLVPALTAAGANILDPDPFFIDQERDRYRVAIQTQPLYYDTHHLTVRGARHLGPVFEPVLRSD